MRKVNFANGRICQNILLTALPMLAAQLLNLLYNIVDRIYIGRIDGVGLDALGGIGLCFPLISLITGFTNLFGSGGAPLCSIALGEGSETKAARVMNTSAVLLIGSSLIITVLGWMFCRPLLFLFGASSNTIQYACPYMMIYLAGTLFSMFSVGMNPFINAQGFSLVGMMSVLIGALINIGLDPVFIFVCHMGASGAALATILSQLVSAIFVFCFLRSKKPQLRLDFSVIRRFSWNLASQITGLGFANFVMQLTNTLVQIAGNSLLSSFGGDLYVSVMTVVSSIRQILDTPVIAISEGASPVLSFNYGAHNGAGIRKGILILTLMGLVYTLAAWLVILISPAFFIRIFNSDAALVKAAVPALKIYLFGYIFQIFQFAGQTVFKSLNRKREAIFFSLFRKVMIGIPFMFILPHFFSDQVLGVFAAEPVSNVIGGLACFGCMLATILPMLRQMDLNKEYEPESV